MQNNVNENPISDEDNLCEDEGYECFYMKEGPTPCGGDCSDIFYLDDNDNPVPKNIATRAIIHELRNGILISTTYGFINRNGTKN